MKGSCKADANNIKVTTSLLKEDKSLSLIGVAASKVDDRSLLQKVR